MTYRDAVDAAKREVLRAALVEAAGNRTQAAKALGLERTYLCALLRRHGVIVPPAVMGRPRLA